MGKINVAADAIAKLKNFASGGDPMARVLQGLLDATRVLTLTPGAEAGGGAAANTIRVLGKVTEVDGTPVKAAVDILITSKPIAGVGTMTDGGKGSIIAGSASVSVWFRTDTNGEFEVDVLNAAAEQNLVVFQLDNGQVESLVLTFA